MYALFFSLLFVTVFGYSMDSLDGQKWDGEFYNLHARPQLDAAKKHLEKISFESCRSIADIGCGSGAITAQIADKLPHIRVVGSDLSSDMIRAARKNHGSRENLTFYEQDAQKFVGNNEFDMAVSFLTLHWVQDKPAFFHTLFKALTPGGKFYLTVGAKNPEIENLKKKFFEALFAQDPQWQFLMKTSMVTAHTALSSDECLQLVRAAGFENLEISEEIENHSFATTHDLGNFVATFISGYKDIAALPAQKRAEFITTAAELWTKECSGGKPSYTWANLVVKGNKPNLS
ncbi:MAG: hypothetical protein AMXMBFR12_08850 [Candidatus Babeliales bacterium]